MASTALDPDDSALRRPVGPPRPIRPVMFLAGVGVLFLAVQLYAWIAWAVSGQMKPAPKGPTPIPDWMEITARVAEITRRWPVPLAGSPDTADLSVRRHGP